MPIRGIETLYKGVRFRSMLEARWAAFFDIIGWRWTYEPFQLGLYIPDFLISGSRPLLLEVKPAATAEQYQRHEERHGKALEGVEYDFIVVGASPVAPQTLGTGNSHSRHTDVVAGWLGEFVKGAGRLELVKDRWRAYDHREWGSGVWTICRDCNKIAIYHSFMSYACRPCGCHDGDHHLGPIANRTLESMWRDAGNLVRWVAA